MTVKQVACAMKIAGRDIFISLYETTFALIFGFLPTWIGITGAFYIMWTEAYTTRLGYIVAGLFLGGIILTFPWFKFWEAYFRVCEGEANRS